MRFLVPGRVARVIPTPGQASRWLSEAARLRYMMPMPDVLFCPFCGEAFEGEAHCPEHELALLPWTELARRRRAPRADEPLAWYSPRAGRGVVFAGALLALIALGLPLARVDAAIKLGGSMLALALHGSPRLWLVPAAAAAELLILRRRTTPLAMRRARLAVALVGAVPALAGAWTWSGAGQAVALLAQTRGESLPLVPAAGAYVLGLASVLLIAGALRLGTARAAHDSSE
jgi:hypothetical protein